MMMVPIAKTWGFVFVPDKGESPWLPCAMVIPLYICPMNTYIENVLTPQCAQCFLNFLTYRTVA